MRIALPTTTVLLTLLALACGDSSGSQRVLLLGDSITKGTVGRPGGATKECELDQCYAARLSISLGSKYVVSNLGVGGATSVDWARDEPGFPSVEVEGTPTGLFKALAAPRLPADVVVVLLGTNDAGGFFEPAPIPAGDYGDNLEVLIDRLVGQGALRVILVKPPSLYGFEPDAQQRIADYASEIDAICTDRVVVECGPDLSRVLDQDDFEPGDVHPNEQGHAAIAAAVAGAVVGLP